MITIQHPRTDIRILMIEKTPWFLSKDISKVFSKNIDVILHHLPLSQKKTFTSSQMKKYSPDDYFKTSHSFISLEGIYTLIDTFSDSSNDFALFLNSDIFPLIKFHEQEEQKEKIILITQNNTNYVSSRLVACHFEKEHKHILRDIENLKSGSPILDHENFFIKSTYQNRGKDYPEYLMTRDGFSLLVMGFTGKKALTWKLKYIEAFNKMEESLKQSISPLDNAALAILHASDDASRMIALAEYTKLHEEPLLLTISEQQKEINAKQEIINGFSMDLPIPNKRALLNKLICTGYSGKAIQSRWNNLYRELLYYKKINIIQRKTNYEKKHPDEHFKSVLEFADTKYNLIPTLFEVAVQIYASDVDKIIENNYKLKEVA